MTEEILKRLDLVASKLNVGAGQLWQVLLKQAQVQAYTDIVLAVVSLAFAVYFTRVIAKWKKDLSPYSDEGALFFLYVIDVVSFFVAIAFAISGMRIMLNPAFWALETIVDQFK